MRKPFIGAILLIGIALTTSESHGGDPKSTQPSTQPRGAVEPPWAELNPKLTDDAIRKMSTEDLAKALFANGVPARVIMSSNSGSNKGIDRLIAQYRGYKEFFDRPDCWKGLVAMVDYFSGQLNPEGEEQKNVNATIGLKNLQDVFAYPKIQGQTGPHRREMIDANLRGLEKLEQYLNATANSRTDGKAQSAASWAGFAAAALVDSTLKLESSIDPAKSKASADAISKLSMDNNYRADDVKKFISRSLEELKSF